MPEQFDEARDAIDKIEEAARRVRQEGLDLRQTDDYKKGKDDARKKYKRLRRKFYNLKKVLKELRGARIRWGTSSWKGELGKADKSTKPPTITIDGTWLAIPIPVLAQVLAHEAIHLLSKSKNSIDQEIRCRRKELEVWELLKPEQPNALHYPCDNEQKLFAQGEDHVRKWLRRHYKGLPEKDERPKKKKKKTIRKKSGAKETKKAHRLILDSFQFIIGILVEFLELFLPEPSYEFGFLAPWPEGYETQETEGLTTDFIGVLGTGPHSEGGRFPAAIDVIEGSDIVHGGDWGEYADHAEYRLDAMSHFNVESFDDRFELIGDTEADVNGQPGRCLEMEYDIAYPVADMEGWRTRVRERTIYTQKHDTLYSISLICEASDWSNREPEFTEFLQGFEFIE
jgi:hypothetical protein